MIIEALAGLVTMIVVRYLCCHALGREESTKSLTRANKDLE
jgi:hypothetical protein